MLKKIQECFRADRVYYSRHARDEMEGEESGVIKDEEVFETVSTGKIIENYPEDDPYPIKILNKFKILLYFAMGKF